MGIIKIYDYQQKNKNYNSECGGCGGDSGGDFVSICLEMGHCNLHN